MIKQSFAVACLSVALLAVSALPGFRSSSEAIGGTALAAQPIQTYTPMARHAVDRGHMAPRIELAQSGQQVSAERIRQAQRMLRDLGYNPGPIDGLYGPRTRAAVERFQRDYGHPVDGRVTQNLISALTSLR